MRTIVSLLVSAALLSGCGQQKAEQERGDPVAAADTSAPVPAATASPRASAGGRDVDEETPLYVFAYAYPWAVGTIPALKDRLDAEVETQRGELAAAAKAGSDEAKASDFPYNKYSRSTGWKVVTDLPGWLSLSARVGSFEGGAHPNYWFNALLWDRKADAERKALDLFTSKAALSAALRPEFCAAIDRQRSKKRGEPVTRDGGAPFSECLDPVAYTVILGSSNGQAFDRIGVLVPPYEAGPYVEGEYEVTLPVTAKVLGLIRPEFRDSFAAAR